MNHQQTDTAQYEARAVSQEELSAPGEEPSPNAEGAAQGEVHAAATASAERGVSIDESVRSSIARSREPIELLSPPARNAPVDLMSSPEGSLQVSATDADATEFYSMERSGDRGVGLHPSSPRVPLGIVNESLSYSSKQRDEGSNVASETNKAVLPQSDGKPTALAQNGPEQTTVAAFEEREESLSQAVMHSVALNGHGDIVPKEYAQALSSRDDKMGEIPDSDTAQCSAAAVTQDESDINQDPAFSIFPSIPSDTLEPTSSRSTMEFTAPQTVNCSSFNHTFADQATTNESPATQQDSDDDDICIITDPPQGVPSSVATTLPAAAPKAAVVGLPSSSVAPPAVTAAAASVPTSRESEPEVIDVDAEPEEVLTFLGSCLFSVVGIQNYDGTAHPGEFVNLIREPDNELDKNAIRVDNLRNEQVGHIMTAQAAPLAVVMDQGRTGVKVDGTIVESDTATQVANDRLSVLIALYARNAPSHNAVSRVATILGNILGSVGFARHPSTFPPQMQPVQRVAEVIDLTAPSMETEAAPEWQTHQQHLDDMFEKQTRDQLANLPDIEMPTQLYQVRLFDHQIAGIKWMVHRETGNIAVPFYQKVMEHGQEVWLCEVTHCSQFHEPRQVKGGILADDMGLGKTIQAISLILANPPRGRIYSPGQNNLECQSLDSKPAAVAMGSLPPRNENSQPEMQLVSNENSMAYHPQQGVIPVMHHSQYAFHPQQGVNPLMTYPQVAVQPRHEASAPVCTLIVSPVSVMSNWVHQIDAHVQSNVLKYAIYHGTNRDSVRAQVQSNEIDVLIVSYNTLAADFTKVFPDEKKKRSNTNGTKRKYDALLVEDSLFHFHFHRLILDEAHLIRNMNTRMFKACKALQSDHRWCLTGTPLQNKPDDINSLFAFLGVEPFGDRDVFRRAISQPIELGDNTGFARLRAMMAHIALRRNKSGINELKLPPKEIRICKVYFPPDSFHKKVHDSLFLTSRAVFQATIREGGDAALLKNYVSVLETLLRIRQACCSGTLVPEERRRRADAVLNEIGKSGDNALSAGEGKELLEKLKGNALSQEQSGEDDIPECAMCLSEMEESEAIVLKTCSHVFCAPCLAKFRMLGNNASCPLCRTAFVDRDMVKKSELKKAALMLPPARVSALVDSDSDQIEASPKIRALLEAIKEMKDDEKGVIFSQFTKFLDIIEPWLHSHGHTFTRIDGSKNATDRIESMKSFSSEDSGPRFMLCSLHAAGTGINLTRGSHLFLMDTWWNMAVEHQAFDRCHRIGQRRNVRILRFIMSGTIEEKMVRIQEAKATMGKGAMEKLDPAEVRQARIGDLKSLFDIGSSADDPIVID